MQLRRELLTTLFEQRFDRPVLDRLERADLPFALDDQSQGDGLHASGGQSLLHGLPEERTRLVADETIEHTTRLLRLDLELVDFARILDRALHRILGDLVKEHTLDRRP